MKFATEILHQEEEHQRNTLVLKTEVNVNQPIWTTLHMVFTYSMLV